MQRRLKIILMLLTTQLMMVMAVLPHHHHGYVGNIIVGLCHSEAGEATHEPAGEGDSDEEGCILHKMQHVVGQKLARPQFAVKQTVSPMPAVAILGNAQFSPISSTFCLSINHTPNLPGSEFYATIHRRGPPIF